MQVIYEKPEFDPHGFQGSIVIAKSAAAHTITPSDV
jgi:hypothetical protein